MSDSDCQRLLGNMYCLGCPAFVEVQLNSVIKVFFLDVVGIHILQELEHAPIAHFHP